MVRSWLCALVLVGCGGASTATQTPSNNASAADPTTAGEPGAGPIDERKRAAIDAHIAHLNNLVAGDAQAMSDVFADDYQYAPDGKDPLTSDTRVQVYEH